MPSTENYITQAAADARYQALGGLGDDTPASLDAGDAGTAGVSTDASRADHAHPTTIDAAELVPAAWLAAWTSWTPTFTNFTLGNGTIDKAKYAQIGKTVHFQLQVTLGSTSAMGDFIFTLPVAPADTGLTARFPYGDALLHDTGTAFYVANVVLSGSPTGGRILRVDPTANTLTAITTTSPFTWTTGDIVQVSGTYEAA